MRKLMGQIYSKIEYILIKILQREFTLALVVFQE